MYGVRRALSTARGRGLGAAVDSGPVTSTTAEPSALERRAIARFVSIVVAVLTACWAAVGLVAAPALPGGAWTAAGAWALLTIVPLALFIATRARSAYPGALVRALMLYCRLPPRLGHALFAAMQLVPDLAGEAQQMRLARAMKSGRRLRRIPGPREALGLAIPLLAYAIRRAGRTAIAMEARGLSPGPRTILHVPGFTWRDGAFAAAALGLIILCSLPKLLAPG